MEPPVAVHVTAVLEAPVTTAVNCCAAPGCKFMIVGETDTCTLGVGWMVICAEAVLVESAAEVAVTAKLPADVPAVKRPVVETVPPVAVQLTWVLELPVTVAPNCCVCPGFKVALNGETETCTVG